MSSATSSCPAGMALSEAWLAPQFCALELPISIDQPRSILSVGTSDLLAVERGTNSVVLLSDSNGDGVADFKTTVVSAAGLNHGLALQDGYLYASSSSTVYRWPYNNGTVVTSDNAEVVINNINADGQGGAPFGHTTRTIIFDADSRLYVSVGSAGNVDEDSFRARIRRFDLNTALPIDFLQGEVFADGLRNEVGLAFDSLGILWGVENGADRLERQDLGGDIHNDNPGEELHRFVEQDVGKHWGYPYCWTEYDLGEFGMGQGTVWAWPSFLDSGFISDEQCRTDYLAAELSMQAHSAPLGITFYEWKDQLPPECNGVVPFPQEMDGYAFIAYHGSWNRDIPTGYKVVYVEMNDAGRVVGQPQDLLMHTPPNAKWPDGFRPVDVSFDDCGRLLVSSDGSRNRLTGVYRGSKMVRIQANSPGREPEPSPSTSLEPEPSPSNSSSSSYRSSHRPRQVFFTLLAGALVILCFS